jgi:outer membrane protein OmpA-like peptidoglycan-associated protein
MTEGITAAKHEGSGTLTVHAAPGGAGHTTVRAAILPFACWRVDDVRFAFDSSIVQPDVKDELAALKKLMDETKGPSGERTPLAVFGHADPVGKDDYNKLLSGRRALAVHALLVRDVARWEALYTKPHGGDSWAEKKAVATMLGELGFGDSLAEKKRFQKENGLKDDGDIGPKSRAVLYQKYMDALAPGFQLGPQDFLARGADPDLKGDVMGCGEFNPAVVLSQAELKGPKAQVEEGNAPNRRVMVFLFRPGTKIDPAQWPCPKALDGVAGCVKRLWSNGQERRTSAAERRRFVETKDTFACRFYHRLADRSPCEGVLPAIRLRLYDADGEFISKAPYRIKAGDVVRAGVADPRGFVVERFASIPETITVSWGHEPAEAPPGPDDALLFQVEARPTLPDEDTDDTALVRLRHLGYVRGKTQAENVESFQWDYQERFGLTPSGALDAPTKAALRAVHDAPGDDLLEGS